MKHFRFAATLVFSAAFSVACADSESSPDRNTVVVVPAAKAERKDNLSIAHAERAGFVKEDQQIFQMVGATDGWAGKAAGETVELYSYADSIPEEFFRRATQENNMGEWAGYCKVRNLVMLYRKEASCDVLRALQ